MKNIKSPPGRPQFNAPQLMCNGVSQPRPEAEKYALVRDPIERFRSGFSHSGAASVDEAIRLLQGSPDKTNIHIRPQAFFLRYIEGVVTFRFPDGIEACAQRIGVPAPKRENVSEPGQKPALTPAQVAALNQVYADDIALFDAALIA